MLKKSLKGKSTHRDSNLWHPFAWQIEIMRTIHHAIAPSSNKDGSMTDFKHTQSDPHGSYWKMLHVLLTRLPPRCALTYFLAPEGQVVKRLRTPPSKVLKEQRYYQGRRESK